MPLAIRLTALVLLGLALAVPETSFALSCEMQLRYGPQPQGGLPAVLALVWGWPGLLILMIAWIGALTLWIMPSAQPRLSRSVAISVAFLVLLGCGIRLGIGAWYFCESSTVVGMLQSALDRGLSVTLGVAFLGLPCSAAGMLIRFVARSAVLPLLGEVPLKKSGGLVPGAVFSACHAAILILAFGLFGWAPLLACALCLITGILFPVSLPMAFDSGCAIDSAPTAGSSASLFATTSVIAVVSAVLVTQSLS